MVQSGVKTNSWLRSHQHRYLVQLGALMSLYPDDKQVSTSTNGVSSINNLFFGPSVAENETRAFHNLLNNYLTWRAIMPFIGYLSKGSNFELSGYAPMWLLTPFQISSEP